MIVNRPIFACTLSYYPITCCGNELSQCSQFCFCGFSSQNQARNIFRQSINALVWESYSLDSHGSYPDFLAIRDNVIKCSDNADGYGFNVMVLDYYNLIQGIYPCMDYQINEVKNLTGLIVLAPAHWTSLAIG